MVYKVYAEKGKALYCRYIANIYHNLICSIDGSNVYLSDNQYIFNFQDYSFEEIAEFFDNQNKNNKIILLYSNLYYNEVKDFITFLETLKHDFIIFMQK